MRKVKQKGRDKTQKSHIRNSLQKQCENKVKHGQFIRRIDRELVSEEDTLLWLSRGDMKAESEAGQDRALQTK